MQHPPRGACRGDAPDGAQTLPLTSFLCARCHCSLISFLRFSCSRRLTVSGCVGEKQPPGMSERNPRCSSLCKSLCKEKFPVGDLILPQQTGLGYREDLCHRHKSPAWAVPGTVSPCPPLAARGQQVPPQDMVQLGLEEEEGMQRGLE